MIDASGREAERFLALFTLDGVYASEPHLKFRHLDRDASPV